MTFPERWVKEYNADTPFDHKIHVIKSLTYRQAISWDGFFSWKHKRNHVDELNHFFNDYHQHDLDSDLRFQNAIEVLKDGDPVITWEWIEHEDLYAFYEYIGYDRETKKFKEV